MARAFRAVTEQSGNRPSTTSCKEDVKAQMKQLTSRVRALSTASKDIKELEDQQQVALYIFELNQKLRALRKQLI